MKNDVVTVLKNRADQVMAATDRLLEHTRDLQILKKFMQNRLGELELTPEQSKKLERYQYIYNQLVTGKYTEQELIKQLQNPKFYNLSLSQAYQDIDATKELMSTVVNLNKLFDMNLLKEQIKLRIRKCEEMGDFKTAAAHEKNLIALLKELPEVDQSPAELFEGHTFEAVFDPKLLGYGDVNMKEVLRVINEKRDKKINLDMFPELEVLTPEPPAP